MRISDAVSDSSPLDVHFPRGAVLHVEYQPSSYSIIELENLQRNATKDPRRMLHAIRRLVLSWDLTDDDGVPIPLAEPFVEGGGGGLVPRSEFVRKFREENGQDAPLPDSVPEDQLASVPTNIFAAIIKAVNADQDPGEVRRP